MEVICNRVKPICVGWCKHSVPHEPTEVDEDNKSCVSSEICVLPGMEYENKFKVKCVKVKKKDKL